MSSNHNDIYALIEALRGGQSAEQSNNVSKNAFHILVMGAAAAAGALVWNTVVAAPKDFGVISQQTAEIRTTVLEMKGTLTDINARLDKTTQATTDQQAKITGLEMAIQNHSDQIERLDREISRGR